MEKFLLDRTNKPSERWPKALVVFGILKYGLDRKFKEVRQGFNYEVKQL